MEKITVFFFFFHTMRIKSETMYRKEKIPDHWILVILRMCVSSGCETPRARFKYQHMRRSEQLIVYCQNNLLWRPFCSPKRSALFENEGAFYLIVHRHYLACSEILY